MVFFADYFANVLKVGLYTLEETEQRVDLNIELRQWSNQSDTAMPGQPLTRLEQAPELHPLTIIRLISKGTWPLYKILRRREKMLQFDLSQKAKKRDQGGQARWVGYWGLCESR